MVWHVIESEPGFARPPKLKVWAQLGPLQVGPGFLDFLDTPTNQRHPKNRYYNEKE